MTTSLNQLGILQVELFNLGTFGGNLEIEKLGTNHVNKQSKNQKDKKLTSRTSLSIRSCSVVMAETITDLI